VREVEEVAFALAREHLAFEEPIPDFGTRYPNVLESCLAVPFQRFYGQAVCPTLVSKAAMLFYLLIKNHPFANGNKRIAVTATLVFLLKCGKWLYAGWEEIYELTVWVAQSRPEERAFALLAIERFFEEKMGGSEGMDSRLRGNDRGG
jgi:death-on-curing family protein